MSRVKATATDGDSASAAAQIRQVLTHKRVCPYCGHQNGGGAEPCPRCTMEDTPATRQATKVRIGPWYVLQSRNPAAPGMKYATLLALIHKGHVTARSIVRGPTTHQLWRFAAHVRGVSREFGMCYSCGGDIDTETSICPHCQRTQDAPVEPDVLIEQRAAVANPIPEPAAASPSVAPEIPSYAARMRELNRQRAQGEAEVRSNEQRTLARNGERAAVPATQQRPRTDMARRSDGRVVSAMELAAALQEDSSEALRVPRRIFRKAVAAIVLLAIVAGAVVWFFVPQYRNPAQAWVSQTWTNLKAKTSSIEWPRVSTHPAPDRQPMPRHVEAVVTPPTPQVMGDPISEAPPIVEPPAKHETAPVSPAPVSLAPVSPAPVSPAPVSPALVTPAPAAPVDAAAQMAAVTSNSAPSPAAAVGAAATQTPPIPAPAVTEKPAPAPIDTADAIEQTRKLWVQAIDLEVNKDFAGAIKLYQQIKTYPSNAWPSGLNLRLEFAQQQAQQSSAE